MKEHLLFSVYLKFFLIASARSDLTAKLEMDSFKFFFYQENWIFDRTLIPFKRKC